MNYQEMHKRLIIESSGIVENNIIIEPGVKIIAKTELTDFSKKLFEEIFISSLPDLNSKITYMNFVEKNLEDIVSKLGHLSIYNDTYVSILITGISVEAELELIAHNEAKIARLTSSRTKAQEEPLFVLPDSYKNKMKEFESYINGIISLRNSTFDNPKNKDELEAYNYLPFKAVSLNMSMSLKDWHKTMIGRLSNEGVEIEIQKIFKKINQELRKEYPNIIKDVDWYYSQGNSKKYS